MSEIHDQTSNVVFEQFFIRNGWIFVGFRILTVWTDVYHGMPLYSVSTHPLNTHEFCVCGRDHVIRVYDQRKCGTNEPVPLYKCYPKKVIQSHHLAANKIYCFFCSVIAEK